MLQYDLKQTTQQVRTALANTWPGVKFWVRSRNYVNGEAIDVYWLDHTAITDREVNEFLYRNFACCHYDSQAEVSEWKPLVKNGEEVMYHVRFIGATKGLPKGVKRPDDPELTKYLPQVGESVWLRDQERLAYVMAVYDDYIQVSVPALACYARTAFTNIIPTDPKNPHHEHVWSPGVGFELLHACCSSTPLPDMPANRVLVLLLLGAHCCPRPEVNMG